MRFIDISDHGWANSQEYLFLWASARRPQRAGHEFTAVLDFDNNSIVLNVELVFFSANLERVNFRGMELPGKQAETIQIAYKEDAPIANIKIRDHPQGNPVSHMVASADFLVGEGQQAVGICLYDIRDEAGTGVIPAKLRFSS